MSIGNFKMVVALSKPSKKWAARDRIEFDTADPQSVLVAFMRMIEVINNQENPFVIIHEVDGKCCNGYGWGTTSEEH